MLFHRLSLPILLCVPVLANGQAPAADREKRFYFGAGLGHEEMVLEDDVAATLDFKGDGLTVRALAGYRLFRFLAIEANYVDYGDPEDRRQGAVRSDGIARSSALQKADFDAFGVSAVGIQPFGPVDLFIKAGIARWDGSLRATRFIPTTSVNEDGSISITQREDSFVVSQNGFGPVAGLGVQFRRGRLAVRGELEGLFLSFDDGDGGRNGRDFIGSLSASFIWSF